MSNEKVKCIICNEKTGDYMERAKIPMCAPCVARHGYDKMPLNEFFEWIGEALGLIEETAVVTKRADDDWYAMVKEFHKTFNHPIAIRPCQLGYDRRIERAVFMDEELREFIDGDNIVDQVDAIIDLIYFAIGTMVEMGVHPGVAFDMVHNANMQKLFPDGRPRWRDGDGKVLKPKGWTGPEHEIGVYISALQAFHGNGRKHVRYMPSNATHDRLVDGCINYNTGE